MDVVRPVHGLLLVSRVCCGPAVVHCAKQYGQLGGIAGQRHYAGERCGHPINERVQRLFLDVAETRKVIIGPIPPVEEASRCASIAAKTGSSPWAVDDVGNAR